MTKQKRSTGVEVELPDGLVMSAGARARGLPLPAGPQRVGPAAGSSPDLVEALIGQDMTLVDTIEIRAKAGPDATRTLAGSEPARITLDLDESEDAVLLLESYGVCSWHYVRPEDTTLTKSARSGVRVLRPRKSVTFVLDVAPPAGVAQKRKRGPVADFLLGQVKAYIFKFAARLAITGAVKILERNVRPGLVHITSEDPQKWLRLPDLSTIRFGTDQRPRVLLLVHGTFSSTVGSYGQLAFTEEGNAFLRAAIAGYDLVIGYDHASLSRDPLENANELLAALQTAKWPQPPLIDVIAFSRGALVLRSLIQYLLPTSTTKMRVRRAIFVGGTNGGTLLAEPHNWETLINLYTNLVVAGCRLTQFIPSAAATAAVIKEAVVSLGDFVKYLTVTAIKDRVVPGLAAMSPSGDFVAQINKQHDELAGPVDSSYCVVTSEFNAELAKDHGSLPAALVRWIADAAVDELMGKANDLVVDVGSMSRFESDTGVYIKDRLDFGSTPFVFHTIYFAQPKVIEALVRWLGLAGAPSEESANETEAAPRSPVVGSATPVRSILVTNSTTPLSEVQRALDARRPSYVVVQREDRGQTLHYALSAEEVAGLEIATRGRDVKSLGDALISTPFELHEHTQSQKATIGEPPRPAFVNVRGATTTARTILFDGDKPHAVIPGPLDMAAGAPVPVTATLADAPLLRGRPVLDGPGGGQRTTRSRHTPANSRSKTSAKRNERVTMQQYFFAASMPQSISVTHQATVNVTISRDAIAVAVGELHAEGEGQIDTKGSDLIVQVIAKKNLIVIGDDRWSGSPELEERKLELAFDVQATNDGEGELWIVIRQGPTKLASLILKPNLVYGAAMQTPGRLRAVADSAPAQPLNGVLPILQIFERVNGTSTFYQFVLDSGLGGIITAQCQPFLGSRAEYVAKIYKDIENCWATTKPETTRFSEKMRLCGADLFDELVPREIQDALWLVRDELRAIHVFSEEPFIPWELVHLKPPRQGAQASPLPPETHFLAQKGLVRWLHNSGNAPLSIKVRKGRRFHLVPAYPIDDYELPAAQEEISFLEKELKAKPVVPASSEGLDRLFSEPGRADLFHFAGHGQAESNAGIESALMMTGRVQEGTYLPDLFDSRSVTHGQNLMGPDANRPIVVLNACQIGRLGPNLTSIGGFADAFVKKSAGIFVGTLWSIGDEPAKAFTEAFYEALKQGKQLAEATVAGRETARAEGSGTWLAYVVYGHPFARVTFER